MARTRLIFILAMLVGQACALSLEGGDIREFGETAPADGGGHHAPGPVMQRVSRIVHEMGLKIGLAHDDNATARGSRGSTSTRDDGDENDAASVCCCYYDQDCNKMIENLFCALKDSHKDRCKPATVQGGKVVFKGGTKPAVNLEREGHKRVKKICEAYADLQTAILGAEPGAESGADEGNTSTLMIESHAKISEIELEGYQEKEEALEEAEAEVKDTKQEGRKRGKPHMAKEFRELFDKADAAILELKGKAKKVLEALLANGGTIEEFEDALKRAEAMHLGDDDDDGLIQKVQDKLDEMVSGRGEALEALEKALDDENWESLAELIDTGKKAGLSAEELEKFEEALKEANKEMLTKLKMENKELTTDNGILNTENNDLEVDINEAEEEIVIDEQEIEDLKEEIKSKDEEIQTLSDASKTDAGKLKLMEEYHNELVDKLEKGSKETIKNIEEELNRLKLENEELSTKNTELEEEVSKQNTKISTLTTEIKSKDEDIKTLSSKSKTGDQKLEEMEKHHQTAMNNLMLEITQMNSEEEVCKKELAAKQKALLEKMVPQDLDTFEQKPNGFWKGQFIANKQNLDKEDQGKAEIQTIIQGFESAHKDFGLLFCGICESSVELKDKPLRKKGVEALQKGDEKKAAEFVNEKSLVNMKNILGREDHLKGILENIASNFKDWKHETQTVIQWDQKERQGKIAFFFYWKDKTPPTCEGFFKVN